MLRAYSVFSREAGEESAAILVFAFTSPQARGLGWGHIEAEDWIDLTARRLKDDQKVFCLGDQKNIAAQTPHVIPNPLACQHCGHWGIGLTNDNKCVDCGEYPGYELVRRLKAGRYA
jgi:hypothetical protein